MSRIARAARLGDSTKGICNLYIFNHHHACPHSRKSIFSENASPNVFINGIAAIRSGDGTAAICPHNGQIEVTGGSGSVFINSRPAARIKDDTTCLVCGQPGNISTGSPNVFFGD